MTPSDPVLEPYLTSSDAQQEVELMTELIFAQAEPVIRRVVNYRLGMDANSQDREDITGDVVLDLLARLQSMKASAEPPAISNLRGYVSVAAQHACDSFLRQRYPQRHRLKNRLRYLLEKDSRFALWEDRFHRWVCGLAIWQGDTARTRRHDKDWSGFHGSSGEPPVRFVQRVLQEHGAPIEFDDFVGLIAELWNVRDERLPLPSPANEPSVPPEDSVARIDRRRRLQRLWCEVAQLPADQRNALLLNLRDEQGGSALAFLPPSGVASVSEIARVLGLQPEQLAELWPRIPLDDLEIANRLGVSRQRVINLRSAARQRLARRLRDKEVTG
jgi:DNA-directed RNA polymerase specialized sigma24 family protein